MMHCTVTDLCRAVNGTLLQGGADGFAGVTTDSRKEAAGQLFIPLVGERFDGHNYLSQAFAQGAVGCLCGDTAAACAYHRHDSLFQKDKPACSVYQYPLSDMGDVCHVS